MGKGDRRTRRGKLYRGSFGKSRPKDPAGKPKNSPRAAGAGRPGMGTGAGGRKR
ncbi:MAG: 30S ribosomal protein THX [Steroidobacteraceae bacterium]